MPREKLKWYVPEDEYDRFEDWVVEKHGEASQYFGFELEEAFREYMDIDEIEDIEDLADRLHEATGRSRETERKRNHTSFAGPTRKIEHRVNSDLKESFAKFADEHHTTYGEAVARAMNERRDGGRVRRIRERLEASIPEAEAALAAIEDDVGGMDKSERVEISIAKELSAQFTEADLEKAIDTVTSGSEYYHEEYAPRVIERKGVTTHPNADHVYLTEKRAAQIRVDTILDRLRDGDEVPAFTRGEAARAIAAEIGVKPTNEYIDEINLWIPRILDRLPHEWDEDAEVFAPPDLDPPDGPTPHAEPGTVTGEITADGGIPVDDRD